MIPFKGDIESLTLKNTNYRKVLFTDTNQHLVLMSLSPHQEIGMEVHPDISQFIRVEAGKGMAIINDKRYLLKNGSAVIIPQGSYHNIINTSKEVDMKIYTIYSPPHHPLNTIHRTKEDEKEA